MKRYESGSKTIVSILGGVIGESSPKAIGVERRSGTLLYREGTCLQSFTPDLPATADGGHHLVESLVESSLILSR
jgi:hypothetical protein